MRATPVTVALLLLATAAYAADRELSTGQIGVFGLTSAERVANPSRVPTGRSVLQVGCLPALVATPQLPDLCCVSGTLCSAWKRRRNALRRFFFELFQPPGDPADIGATCIQ